MSLAQTLPGVPGLPAPGQMVLASESFVPVMLRGIQLVPDKPLEFGFLIDSGNTGLAGDALKAQTEQLVKYFLTSLAVPDEHLWVNLSPGEDQRIVPDDFGITAMGRDLLSQDYMLKQLTASLIHPDQDLGKEFWKRVADKVREQFGDQDIPTDAFSRVWVVPDKAVVLENNGTALIAESRLRVMLEEDYHAMHENLLQADTRHQTPDTGIKEQLVSCVRCQVSSKDGEITQAILREVIIPELEREVNEGEHFAALRQIYHAMILAVWFKRHFQKTLLGAAYIGQNRLSGIDTDDWTIKEKIYTQYMEALKSGVFDMIREDADPKTGEVMPRRYFSGGMPWGKAMRDAVQERSVSDEAMLSAARNAVVGALSRAAVNFKPQIADEKLQGVISRQTEMIGKLKAVGPVVFDHEDRLARFEAMDTDTGATRDVTLKFVGRLSQEEVLTKLSRGYDYDITTRMLLWFEAHFNEIYVYEEDDIFPGIGTGAGIAISENLVDQPLGILRVIAQSMANTGALSAEMVLSCVNDRAWYDTRVAGHEAQGREVFYALEALFRELGGMDWSSDHEGNARMSDQELVRRVSAALDMADGGVAAVVQEFRLRREAANDRNGEERLLKRLIAQQRFARRSDGEAAAPRQRDMQKALNEIARLLDGVSDESFLSAYNRAAEMIQRMFRRFGRKEFMFAVIDYVFDHDLSENVKQFLISEMLGEHDLLVPGIDWALSRLFAAEDPFRFEYLIEPILAQAVRYVKSAENDWNKAGPLVQVLMRHMFTRFETPPSVARSVVEQVIPKGSSDFSVLFKENPDNPDEVLFADGFLGKCHVLFRSEKTLLRLREIFKQAYFSYFILHRLMDAVSGDFQDVYGRVFQEMRDAMDAAGEELTQEQVLNVLDEVAPIFIKTATAEDLGVVYSILIDLLDQFSDEGESSDQVVSRLAYFAPLVSRQEDAVDLAVRLLKNISATGTAMGMIEEQLRSVELKIEKLLSQERQTGVIDNQKLEPLMEASDSLQDQLHPMAGSIELNMRVLILMLNSNGLSAPAVADKVYGYFETKVLKAPDVDPAVKSLVLSEMVRSTALDGNSQAMRLVVESLSLTREERETFESVVAGVRRGDMSYEQVRKILGGPEHYEDTDFLIIVAGNKNPVFLQNVIEDPLLPSELRIYAAGWYVYHFLQAGNVQDSAVYEQMRTKFRDSARGILEGIVSNNAGDVLLEGDPLMSHEMLKVFLLAEVMFTSNQLAGIPFEAAEKIIQKVMQGKMYFHLNNARSSFVIGARGIEKSASPAHQTIMLLAHELFHNVSRYVFGLSPHSLRHSIMSEFLSDVGAMAMAARLGFSEGVEFYREDLDYVGQMASVMADNFFTVESHEGARAQLAVFLDRCEKYGVEVDWQRLLEVSYATLKRMFDSYGLVETDAFFEGVFMAYFGGEAAWPVGKKISSSPEFSYVGLFPEENALYFTGPMRERIFAKKEIDAMLKRMTAAVQQGKDKAMLARREAAKAQKVGGVDLSERWLDLEVKAKAGDGFSMQEAMSALGLEYLIGITPVIVEIVPLPEGNFLAP